MNRPDRIARAVLLSFLVLLQVVPARTSAQESEPPAGEPAPPVTDETPETPAAPAAPAPPTGAPETADTAGQTSPEDLARELLPALPRELGEVRILSGPVPCDGQECYRLVVKCPQLAEPERAELKIGLPKPKKKLRGTILFTTGLGGKGLWEEFGSGARSALRKLRSAGYRTVQLTWDRGWIYSGEGHSEGQAALACKPATVAKWLLDRYEGEAGDGAFCASGSSAGASLTAYMLSDYGLADRIDAAVMTGGPVFARLDWGCGMGGASKEEFTWNAQRRKTIDGGYGFTREGGGPCMRGDKSFIPRLIEESHLGPGRELVFPRTSVWVLVGALDDIGAVPQARIYSEALQAAGSPDVHFETIKKTPHGVPSTSRGAKRVRKLLLEECKPR